MFIIQCPDCSLFVPADFFCISIIVSLLKDKYRDSTRLEMYRGIRLSSAVSKPFESVLVDFIEDAIHSSELQFGFKTNNSCFHVMF